MPRCTNRNFKTQRNAWIDKGAYDKMAQFLAGLFNKNFEKFSSMVDEEIRTAAPAA
jgi:phosphoenolpyruvate carboxykinase (ATP)